MSFEVVEKKSSGTGLRLNYPALNLTKNTSTFNFAFCQALGIKKVGTKLLVQLLFDKTTDRFALKINKVKEESTNVAEEPNTIVITYNKSRQCQIYLRSMLRQLGYIITKSFAAPVEYDEKLGLWIFTLPKECKASEFSEVDTEENDKKLKNKLSEAERKLLKKSKRKNKNKNRKASDIVNRE
jgi:hypothetical protein